MRVRWIGLTLLLALLGGAAGYAIGVLGSDGPDTSAAPEPVPAESPSYPVNEYLVNPDPGIAPLPPDLPIHEAKFVAGGLTMTAGVPTGWRRVPLAGRDSWNFSDPDNPSNTYLLRIGIDAGDRVSLTVARESRIAALEDAQRNGAIERFRVEQRTHDGFVATYLSEGYFRVAMERWLPQHGSDQAFAVIAITGRDRDREGMADLVERVAASAEY